MQELKSLPKNYLRYPVQAAYRTNFSKLMHALKNLFLFPVFMLFAYFKQPPGLAFRLKCIFMGFKMLLGGAKLKDVYQVVVIPMDSVRYFEFDFMWNAVKKAKPTSYLDVSSPRLLPLATLLAFPKLKAEVINPDPKDLPITVAFAQALKVAHQCNFHSKLISEVDFGERQYDVVSCISVLEHIPNDIAAVDKMWSLVKPGGKLLISVPCAANASEEYINVNEYGLIAEDSEGFVFWQRYYDDALIQERIYAITGTPSFMQIYAEKVLGSYEKNVYQKRTSPSYPYWREPLMMAETYEYKTSIAELSGIGVVAFEFTKEMM